MSLHINLYHEIQREKLARQRDPLKLSLMGLAVIAVGFIFYYAYRWEIVREINVRRASIENEWNAKKPQMDTDKAREAELTASINISEKLSSHIEGRFYWAPLLQEILQIVPRNVQVLTLEGHLAGDKANGCNVSIVGIGAGQEPRRTAEELRTSFLGKLGEKHGKVSSMFTSLDETPQMVQFDNTSNRTATFTIHLDMEGAPGDKLADAGAKPVEPRRRR